MPTILDLDSIPQIPLPDGRGKTIPLFNPSNCTKNVDVHVNILNPGVTRGTIHYHKKIENVYVILEGEGKIVDKDGKEYPVRAGQAVFLKPGQMADTHEIYNTGKGPLKLIEVYAPAQPEEAYSGHSLNRDKRDHVPVRRTE